MNSWQRSKTYILIHHSQMILQVAQLPSPWKLKAMLTTGTLVSGDKSL